MDPPATIEPTANTAQEANSTLSYASNPTHPGYDEMIAAAITALNEKGGSSRIAIAKYIDRVYSNLPLNHSALLTDHLKQLKNTGRLVMVKHSYMLPGSANGAAMSEVPAQPQAQFHLQFPPQQQFQPQMPFQAEPQFQFQPQQHGYVVPEPQSYAGVGPESVFASLGLVDGPIQMVSAPFTPIPVSTGVSAPSVQISAEAPGTTPATDVSTIKRRPGRPRKDGSVVKEMPEPKLLDQSGVKRGRGRPPKGGTVNAAPGSAVGAGPEGRRKTTNIVGGGKRGRPRKNVAVTADSGGNEANLSVGAPVAATANSGGNGANLSLGAAENGALPMHKRRGRPPKGVSKAVFDATGDVTEVPIAAAVVDSANLDSTTSGATNVVLPHGKRRGRPPKSSSGAGVKKPRKLSGKPLGRPRKNVTSTMASEPKLLVAYEELKGKVEYLQSRIRETANLVKPFLNRDTEVRAIAAFQELEELAGMGVNSVQQD